MAREHLPLFKDARPFRVQRFFSHPGGARHAHRAHAGTHSDSHPDRHRHPEAPGAPAVQSGPMDDEALLRQAEAALAEIDRATGLSDEHASVLAALRIRLEGAPRATLEDMLRAAGDLRGRRSLDDPPPAKAKPSLEDAVKKAASKKEWPGL